MRETRRATHGAAGGGAPGSRLDRRRRNLQRFDAGLGRAGEMLFQLCGEVLLARLPSRQPAIVRSGAAVGLELLDLLMNPHHVLRITEELTLRNTWALGRQVQLDVSLDRLSRQSEEGAMQLSSLISGHAGSSSSVHDDAVDTNVERLWLPLDTVPRPVSVSVAVTGNDGAPLARPPQREVRLTLEAALYHILRESLRAHPDFAVAGSPVNVMMRHDEAARWLLQTALLSVCEHGPGTPRSTERLAELQRRLPDLAHDAVSASAGDEGLYALLDKLASDETSDASRRTALEVLRDALSNDLAFLDLLDLVHRHYFVVAGLDRRVREQSLQFDLPDSEALGSSVIKNVDQRSRRMLDPREHNYTVHMWVPLPENIRQYNLHVRTPPGRDEYAYSEVSLIAAIHYDDHPGRTAIDAISTCADELTRTFDNSEPAFADALTVGLVESHAVAALDRLTGLVDLQCRAADELSARWAQTSTWTVGRTVSQLRKVTTRVRDQLADARCQLTRAEASLTTDGTRERAQQAGAALDTAARSTEHPLLGLQLVSSELPGQEVARIRIGRSMLASRARPRPRFLEVWATVSDEARPYAFSSVGPPLILALMIYGVGSLLFDAYAWPLHMGGGLDAAVANGAPDAIVAVLLLVPALALTQFRVPERWSVPGRLHTPVRVFVLGSVVTIGTTAIMVATQVGGNGQAHPHLVLWTFRGALVVFLLLAAWEQLSSRLRLRYAWRPKGLKPVFGAGAESWPALVRPFSYESKAPDAEFDLSLPTRWVDAEDEGA